MNKEEIKKEIKNIHWVDLGVDECDKKTIAKLLKHQEFILKILDKYKEKECNYKNAWEELKQFNSRNETRTYEEAWVLTSIQELETKHGIEVE